MSPRLDDAALERAARTAYERGRLTAALPVGLAGLALGMLAASTCSDHSHMLMAGLALAAVSVAGRWRGGAIGSGIVPGLAAGASPLLACLATCALCVHLGSGLHEMAVAACLAGGVVGGIIVGTVAARRGASAATLFSAGAVALVVGVMGCVPAGMGGMVGVLVGMALGGAPVYALVRRRAFV